MPQPQQPYLHDLVVVLAAPTQVWSARSGNIARVPDRPSAQGVVHGDVGVLRRLDVLVDGQPGEHLATRVDDQEAIFTAVLRHIPAAAPRPDPQLRLDRVRRVEPGAVRERLVLTSVLPTEVNLAVSVRAETDAASMASIKIGVPDWVAEPSLKEQEPGRLSWTVADFTLSVAAPGAELTWRDGRVLEATWSVTIPAHGHVELAWTLEVSESAGVVAAAPPRRARTGALPVADERMAPWLSRSLADLDSLRMVLPDWPENVFLGAGAPWYLTLFGRDSIWAARLLLPPPGTLPERAGEPELDLARGTLRTLAQMQGDRVGPDTAEEPGKILHELRRSHLALGPMLLPPVYYGTVDATPLWVCLLHDAWRAGLDDASVVELLPHLVRALNWLLDYGDADGDGFVEYVDASGHGLANQGWKDSVDAVRFADGELAEGPVALCEVQGYAYEAARSGADLLDAFGWPGGTRYRGWADALQDRFRGTFWCGRADDPYPALALDGKKRQVDALTSNIGHLLGTGLLDGEEERLVARHVASPALDSGLGLRTMAASAGGYSPLSYHCGSVWPHDTAIVIVGLVKAGLADHAGGLIEGLLRASVAFDGRLPELWSGEGRPVPYPAACRPQAWAAAAAVVVAHLLATDQGDGWQRGHQ